MSTDMETWPRCGRPTADGGTCRDWPLRGVRGCVRHLTTDERDEIRRMDAALADIRAMHVDTNGAGR